MPSIFLRFPNGGVAFSSRDLIGSVLAFRIEEKKNRGRTLRERWRKEKSLLEGAEKTRAGARAGGGERESIRKRRKRTRAQT